MMILPMSSSAALVVAGVVIVACGIGGSIVLFGAARKPQQPPLPVGRPWTDRMRWHLKCLNARGRTALVCFLAAAVGNGLQCADGYFRTAAEQAKTQWTQKLQLLEAAAAILPQVPAETSVELWNDYQAGSRRVGEAIFAAGERIMKEAGAKGYALDEAQQISLLELQHAFADLFEQNWSTDTAEAKQRRRDLLVSMLRNYTLRLRDYL